MLVSASIIGLIGFSSCQKEPEAMPSNSESTTKEVQTVPFFELASGDTIDKSIKRLKPEGYTGDEILFSTEDNELLKSTGAYITEIWLGVDRATKADYWKIPVNLNDYAGGYPIYLWYKRGHHDDAIRGFKIHKGDDWGGVTIWKPWELVKNSWTMYNLDLNLGAGGSYLYLTYKKESGGPVTTIAILSTWDKHGYKPYLQNGWRTLGDDVPERFRDFAIVSNELNHKAGGTYIYLLYKTAY